MDDEAFYDHEIAPLLREVSKKCQERQLNFIAHVEFAPGEYGTTLTLGPERCVVTKLVHWSARCKGNVDALIGAILKDAREHGHGSIYLELLGVPASDDPQFAANSGFAAFTISKGD